MKRDQLVQWTLHEVRGRRDRAGEKHTMLVGVRDLADGSRRELEAFILDPRDPTPFAELSPICEMAGSRTNIGVRITNGYVLIEDKQYRGMQIGAYCFNLIVQWAKDHHADRIVEPIEVSEPADMDPAHRNAFYKGFGIKFKYSQEAKHPMGVGESLRMRAGELRTRSTEDLSGIRSINLVSHLVEGLRCQASSQLMADRHAADYKELAFPQHDGHFR
ncbi:hypothetical protein [Herbaspirillum seropedicae]|uniref:hypothetical protein n=1 Tax=Herbaspirillum seropedicae TaxID=964 RepID=UPI002856ECA9|nr:hypothetical protein [Herbaspirillum seropedicae]MDR6397892.1 GNAT superfamily N-acetyltransferase [Herbaspirillum seropedicae]